MADFFVLN